MQKHYVSIEDVYGWLYESHFRGSGDHRETVLLRISFSTFKINSFGREYNGVKDVFSIDFECVIDHFFSKNVVVNNFFCKSDNSGIWDSDECHTENDPKCTCF